MSAVVILFRFYFFFRFRTLHKQGMYGGRPSVKRTLIITPGSLVTVRPHMRPFVIISLVQIIGSFTNDDGKAKDSENVTSKQTFAQL